jgi:hypothetical protein
MVDCQLGDNPKRLRIAFEAFKSWKTIFLHQFIKYRFSAMPERWMAQIVGKSGGLYNIRIEPIVILEIGSAALFIPGHVFRQSAPNLRNLQTVRQSIVQKSPLTYSRNLCNPREPSKRSRI